MQSCFCKGTRLLLSCSCTWGWAGRSGCGRSWISITGLLLSSRQGFGGVFYAGEKYRLARRLPGIDHLWRTRCLPCKIPEPKGSGRYDEGAGRAGWNKSHIAPYHGVASSTRRKTRWFGLQVGSPQPSVQNLLQNGSETKFLLQRHVTILVAGATMTQATTADSDSWFWSLVSSTDHHQGLFKALVKRQMYAVYNTWIQLLKVSFKVIIALSHRHDLLLHSKPGGNYYYKHRNIVLQFALWV